MTENRIFILGTGISNVNSREVLEEIRKWLANGPKTYQIFTPNPEILVLGQKDREFTRILNITDLALPDGQGLILASRFLKNPLKEKVAGSDLLEKLAAMASKEGVTVGLIGGGSGIALRALECLQKNYPGLKGWAEAGPEIKLPIEYEYDWDKLIKKIKETETKIIFVGLGAPKQEYFINNLKSKTYDLKSPLILMAVGGTFDYLSGKIPRAPKWVQELGLEWLYRLVRQPWRIKRQSSLLTFIWLVLKEKITLP